ncbi:unnamed protein product, partial [Oppiella nova]
MCNNWTIQPKAGRLVTLLPTKIISNMGVLDESRPQPCINTPVPPDDKPLARVQVFYSPYNQAAIDFIKLNKQDNPDGLYELMLPEVEGEVKNKIEVDYIPWGRATRDKGDTGFAYTCPDDDTDCIGTRLHACIARNHVRDMVTHLLHLLLHGLADTANALTACAAKDNVEGNGYLDEVLAATDGLYPEITPESDPLILINGVRNDKALTKVRYEVCKAIPKELRPEPCSDVTEDPDVPVDISVPTDKVKVQVYYSPYSTKSIDLIKLNAEGNDKGLYELMLPEVDGETKYNVEVDYIPWGRATRDTETGTGKFTYTCAEGDDTCIATRLHGVLACIARNHVSLYHNHHEFYMILCTTNQDTWITDPLAQVAQCARDVNDEGPDEGIADALKACAAVDNTEGNGYLNEVLAATDILYPGIDEDSDPLVLINGKRSANALTDLKTAVCNAFTDESRPQPCTNTPVPPDDKPLAKVQVFYSPYSQAAIDFIKLNKQDNPDGLYELMLPEIEGEVKNKIEVDYIPWGRATRDKGDTGFAYTCPDDDTDCIGTRLHACIARNHVSLYHNHHEFYMILCTTDQDTWKTNPLAQVVQCVNEVNDEVPDADTANALTACAAKDNVEGNGYLDEVLAATDGLYPEITPESDPLILINGVRNDKALTKLRYEVCKAIPKELRPAPCSDVPEDPDVPDDTIVPANTVRVQVYYSPYSPKSIDLIKLNAEGNDKGLYELMLPEIEGETKYNVEVDYIPWGRATRDTETGTGKFTYTCAEGDDTCIATRLHACIARNHVSLYHNHHEFYMILCTTNQDTWTTDPLAQVAQCARDVNDEGPDEGTSDALKTCAGVDNTEGNGYLNEVLAATDILYPEIDEASDPLVLINGKRSANALTDLKSAVCNAFTDESRPAPCTNTPVPPDDNLLARVQVFYSPYSQKAIDFIKINKQDNPKGLYELMLPEIEGEVKNRIEVDYIPWGRATRDKDDTGKFTYTCPENDNDCVATRLHACIARNHVSLYHNHHEFYMILCVTEQEDWTTDPLAKLSVCAQQVNDEGPDEGTSDALKACAAVDSVEGNSYLNEVLAATDELHPLISTGNPLVLINSIRNDKALVELKFEVCKAIPKDQRPTLCADVTDDPDVPDDTIVPANTVRVQVYYSPYSPKSIDLIKLNAEGNDKGLYELMLPEMEGETKYNVEVDYIPWGRATRDTDTGTGKFTYTCAEGDTTCIATRLHACIARNHVSLYHNHHEFYMILCTTNQDTWTTDPLAQVAQCARDVNDEGPDEGTSDALKVCAAVDNAEGNGYLNEVLAATDILYPEIDE